MPFLRKEFSKIFENLLTMTIFTEMAHIYDLTKKQKLKVKTWDSRWYILKLVGWKIFSRKLLYFKWTHESLPSAWTLNAVLITELLQEYWRILSKRLWFSLKLSVVEIFLLWFLSKNPFWVFWPKIRFLIWHRFENDCPINLF